MKVRIEVRRARTKRVSAWVVACERHGVIGDPSVMRWSKAKAKAMAGLHAQDQHPAERPAFVVSS